MYAGYDTYWMYDNRRHEPEPYFQKNDNNFYHTLPQRQKQVQGKGSSNNMYSYAPHPNTVTPSHHNDQSRVTNAQSMLPPQACLPPYPSSLTHQYLPDEVCTAQPNSVPDSSRLTCVPLQNQVLRNVQNYNPGQTVNYKASVCAVNNWDSSNNRTQTSCIRVKDFSLLNNNNKNNNCNSLLVSGYHQSQQKRPWYYLHDSSGNRQNRTSSVQIQRDCNNQTATAGINYSNLNYGSTPSHHVSNGEQYSQYSQCSAALYQHSAQYERQACLDNSNYPAAQRKNSTRTVIQEADEQRRLDARRHSEGNAYNSTAFNMSEPNEVNPASQAQLTRPDAIQNALQSPSISTSRAEQTAKSPCQNSNNEVASLRVTVPGPAQTTPNLDNSTEASKNSDSSSNLVNVTLRDCAGDRVNNQKEGFESSECNAGVSQLDQQEAGCVRNEENQNQNLNQSLPKENQSLPKESQNLRKETVIVRNTERVPGCVITPKAENPGVEKDNLEDEKAGCPGETKVIKSEVDSSVEKEKTANKEKIDSAESGRLKTENAEKTDPLLLEQPKDKPETASTTLNESQESDVVILDETETSTESTEDGGRIDRLEGEDKCKSKIDRDKLDLLIKFLKKDGEHPEVLTIAEDDSPPLVTNQQGEEPPKKSRRKLSKASIVRNKNTEREMISLVSYKAPRSSSAKSSSTEDSRTASPESSDCSRDNDSVESVSEDKQPEEEEEEEEEEGGGGGQEPQDTITPEDEEYDKSPTESTCECFCDGRGITREERTLINIMRAFQSLKKHFCANCAFTSPVESIWINIVSGELHCLNCFKKMISKAEENHWSNSKKCKVKVAVARKDEEGAGKVNEDGKNPEKKTKCEGQTPAKEAYRREDLKDRVEEKHGICFEKSGDLKKDGGCATDKKKREPRSDEGEKPRKTKSTEEALFGEPLRLHEKHRKKGRDEVVDSSAGSRKRSKSAEEFFRRKKPLLEEDVGDLRQDKVIRRDRHFSRSHSRDSWSSHSSTVSGKAAEKSKKHESGMSKTPGSTEGRAEQKSHKTKEGRAEHESRIRRHDATEKAKMKSLTPEEEIALKRARIKNFSEKSKTDVEKNRTAEKRGDDRTEKARKNGEVKERSRSPKNHEEDSSKSEKAPNSSAVMRRRWKRVTPESRDPTYVPPWRELPEERKPSRTSKRGEAVESHLPRIPKKRRECSVSEDEEITKQQKTRKISDEKPSGKHYKSSKQCLISKLFKGKRCLKVNPSNKYLNKEVHKNEPQREEERRTEKETKESRCMSQPGSTSFHRPVDSSKKRHSGEELPEGKETQQRTGKKEEEAASKSPKEDKRDKAVGGILEGIVNGTGPKTSDNDSPLFLRLMKTTTKLSLRLLGET